MEKSNNNSSINNLLLGGCVVTSMIGGLYLLYNTYKNEDTIDEKEKESEIISDINTTTTVSNTHKNKENSLSKIQRYLSNKQFEKLQKQLLFIKEKLLKEQNEKGLLSKQLVCLITGSIKEIADYTLTVRNADYLKERREQIGKTNYEQLCKDFFNIYTFCLTLAKKTILKSLKIRTKVFKESLELYCNDEIIYSNINYYNNLYDNLKNEKLAVLNENTLLNLFYTFSNKLISAVADIEIWLKQQTSNGVSEEEINNLYAVKLNFARLKISDEIYKEFNADENQIKYYLFNVRKLDEIKHKEAYSLLERVNGVELIALGFS